jgi:hypothetical protein
MGEHLQTPLISNRHYCLAVWLELRFNFRNPDGERLKTVMLQKVA